MDKKREKAIRDLMMLKMIVNSDFAEAIEMAVSALMNEEDDTKVYRPASAPVEAMPWWYVDYRNPGITWASPTVTTNRTVISC